MQNATIRHVKNEVSNSVNGSLIITKMAVNKMPQIDPRVTTVIKVKKTPSMQRLHNLPRFIF